MNKYDALGFYAILELPSSASSEKIKFAYHEKAKYWHPDQNTAPNALEIFQKISAAYDTLKDNRKRMQYDLLSLVYDEKNFPPLGSLKIYKNQQNKNDKSLRVLQQRRVTNGKIKESKDICNSHEARSMVLSTSIHNWLCGWWGKNGLKNNINALKFNLHSATTNNNDNLKLLIHNAVAYDQENNTEMAWIYAKQALLMCKDNQVAFQAIQNFINNLNFSPKQKIKLPLWNPADLKIRQLLFPFALFTAIMLSLLLLFVDNGILNRLQHKNKPLYSSDTVSPDMLETKVMKVESSIDSYQYIIHLTKDTDVYYAPGKQNDIITQLPTGQTLRITGYTFDKKWYQIIMDNGRKGYIQSINTEIGIGNPIPYGSKVYEE